jgi:osmotically-inducible protein OsmY
MVNVTGITNNITIKSESADEIARDDIESAISRNRSINNKDVIVSATSNEVTLSGDVRSWYQEGEVEGTAWNAPGVLNVDNQPVIDYDYEFVKKQERYSGISFCCMPNFK